MATLKCLLILKLNRREHYIRRVQSKYAKFILEAGELKHRLQVVKTVRILISASTSSYGQHLCGNVGVWLFFFFFFLNFLPSGIFSPRNKQWIHSMAFNCSCILLISKFQWKISSLLWVSKWNTLIKFECLASFQTWGLDHASYRGGFDFLFSVKENYPTQLVSPHGYP